MVAILGPSFFDTGQPMLEAACMNIAHWYVLLDSISIYLLYIVL